MEQKIGERFKNIKEKDRKNIDAVLKVLEEEGLKADLRGSSTHSSNYNDIDLNVWDTKKPYRNDEKPINDALKNLEKIRILEIAQPFMACWVRGRWQFDYNGTKFDLVYTPWGPSFVGYY